MNEARKRTRFLKLLKNVQFRHELFGPIRLIEDDLKNLETKHQDILNVHRIVMGLGRRMIPVIKLPSPLLKVVEALRIEGCN